MPGIVPFTSMTKAKAGYLRLRSTVQGLKQKSEKQIMGIARTAEVGLAAGTAGVMNGYFNNPQIGPVPIDVGLGAALKLTSIVMGGDLSDHLSSISDGFIGGFIYRKAARMGLEASAEANGVEAHVILTRRESNLNDDGTPVGAEGEHPGGG